MSEKPAIDCSERNRVLNMVMIAVAAWGTILAIGTTLFGIDHVTRKVTFAPSLIRGAITFFFVAAFVGFWFVAVRRRKSRDG